MGLWSTDPQRHPPGGRTSKGRVARGHRRFALAADQALRFPSDERLEWGGMRFTGAGAVR